MRDEKPVNEVPEVQDFVDADDVLNAFVEAHDVVFQQFRALAEDRNDKLTAADRVCRTSGMSCGPWNKYQVQTKYNAEALFDMYGREQALACGGVMTTKTTYSVDKAKIEASIASGVIPKSDVSTVQSIMPKYKTPKPVAF